MELRAICSKATVVGAGAGLMWEGEREQKSKLPGMSVNICNNRCQILFIYNNLLIDLEVVYFWVLVDSPWLGDGCRPNKHLDRGGQFVLKRSGTLMSSC